MFPFVGPKFDLPGGLVCFAAVLLVATVHWKLQTGARCCETGHGAKGTGPSSLDSGLYVVDFIFLIVAASLYDFCWQGVDRSAKKGGALVRQSRGLF